MLNNGRRTKIQCSADSWERDLSEYEFKFEWNWEEFREFTENSHACNVHPILTRRRVKWIMPEILVAIIHVPWACIKVIILLSSSTCRSTRPSSHGSCTAGLRCCWLPMRALGQTIGVLAIPRQITSRGSDGKWALDEIKLNFYHRLVGSKFSNWAGDKQSMNA